MCGICGEIRFDGAPADANVVRRMMRVLEQRGPDASGLVAYTSSALGHRRLKIFDLSERARQPMVDPELGVSIVYNGAIYNYRELREALTTEGYRFFSTGDTEVLLKAYHAWGERFVERLNGMFAFVIVEHESGKVVMGRDRLGIKPLYLAEIEGGLRFASSLPSLLAGGGIATDIDPVALHHYLTFHAVVPAPRTMLSGIRKLPPATVLCLDATGQRRQQRYWTFDFSSPAGEPFAHLEQWKAETLDVLRRSVERRNVADVPVGVLLSGGLDSSLIVGLLAETGQRNIETFSIGFESVRGEAGDEFRYSELIAQRFGTKHHRLFIDSSRALPALTECISAMSEPMVSHDNIGFFLLSQEVKKHVKVVQSGQGADEVFAGYHWYPPMMTTQDPAADYAKHFFDRSHAEMGEVLEPEWVSEDYSTQFVEGHFSQHGAQRAIDKALRIDTQVMLVDDPVKRVDNMTMASGLEARVPFLDHEVVEFAARVPAELKVKDGGKYLLKEAARAVIPADVIDRPKGYFPVPALKYLRGPFLDLVRETLQSPTATRRRLFRPSYVQGLLAAPDSHITPLGGSKLWQLALLELWLRTHVDQVAPSANAKAGS